MELPFTRPRRPDSPSPVFHKIGIVGLGLIGGSIALAARQAWPTSQVIGVDRPDVIEAAIRMHAVDVAAAGLDVLAEADLIVLAAPVRENVRLLAELDAHVPGAAVITDAGSTKRDIVAAAASLPERFTFVGGHPLGGAAVSGIEHARPDLFWHRPWLFTPSLTTPTETLAALEAFATALGARPSTMNADEHDRALGFLSHLPQLTASALMAVIGDAVGAEGLALAGRGLADTTRLASSPPEIWRDIVATNADQIRPALDALIAALEDLRSDLSTGDRLSEIFTAAADWRARLAARSTL